MRNKNKFVLLLLLPVLLFVGVGAFAQNLILMHDKGGNPNYQPFFEQVGKDAVAAVGVGFTPTPYPDTSTYIAAVRAALPTEKAPDLFTWWSTYRMKDLIDQGLVADMTDLWDKHKAGYPKGVRDAFTFNGKVYGLCDVVEYWGVWYNKAVFAKYDLTVPTTWAEFLKVCDTLKKNGVTPMEQTVQGRWPTFIMFEEMVARQDPQLYVDLCDGKVKYTDPRVKQAFAVWADLIRKGYFTDPSTDLFADAPRLFNSGEVAMVPCGSWYLTVLTGNGVPEENCGIFIMPPVNPRAGKVVILEASPILIGAKAPNLEAAKKVADWWMGPEGNADFAKLVNQFPPNSKADASFLPASKVALKQEIVSQNYRVLNRYWEATPTPICEKAVDKFAEFILKPGSVNQVLSDLDKIAADFWAKNK
ncbi:MAG: extracellular solute-binding protein [Spirochaetia bacterium]|jgi:multiple sugar transport system substrate-binding protein/raffinose/stachyose/melibiose transport system substrate-binding protein